MTPVHHHEPGSHDVETALEASCGLLMALESIRSQTSDADVLRVHAHVQQAIEFVRRAITELRLAHSNTASPIALGFVAAAPRESQPRKG